MELIKMRLFVISVRTPNDDIRISLGLTDHDKLAIKLNSTSGDKLDRELSKSKEVDNLSYVSKSIVDNLINHINDIDESTKVNDIINYLISGLECRFSMIEVIDVISSEIIRASNNID